MKMKPHHKTKLLVALRGHAVRVEEMERVTDYTHSWRKVQNIKGQSARKWRVGGVSGRNELPCLCRQRFAKPPTLKT
jgi:hypothetical protein